MSKKELIVIAVLIAVFAGLYYFRSGDKVSYKLPKSPQIKKEQVDEITIKTDKDFFDIVKKDGKWYLKKEGIPVKKGFVDNLLEKVGGLRFTALVSTTGNYNIYELDKKAVTLKIFEKGKKVLELKVGKNSPTYTQTYVLLENNPNVYQIDGNLKNNVKKKKEDIIDKRVLNFDSAKANKLSFDYGKEKFSFEKKDGKWSFAGGKEAKNDRVKEIVESLSTLSAANVFPDLKGKIKEKPEKTIVITTDKDIVLKCYGLKDTDFLCESSEYPMPFTLTGTLYKTIFKEKKYFIKKDNKKKNPKKTKTKKKN